MTHRIYHAVVVMAIVLGGSRMLSGVARAADTVDGIHCSYGDSPDSGMFDWRGDATAFSYGLLSPDETAATAHPSSVTRVDTTGPSRDWSSPGSGPAPSTTTGSERTATTTYTAGVWVRG